MQALPRRAELGESCGQRGAHRDDRVASAQGREDRRAPLQRAHVDVDVRALRHRNERQPPLVEEGHRAHVGVEPGGHDDIGAKVGT